MARRQGRLRLPSPSDDVSAPTSAYLEMERAWELPRALMGGTAAMRQAGEKYLPKEPGESPEAYANRLHRSTLYNAFAEAVNGIVDRVFSKPLVLGDDVPEQIRLWTEDVDLAGRHIDVFARQVFLDGIVAGKAHILVDRPKRVRARDEAGNEREPTLADEAGNRPYLVSIRAEDLIGWRTEEVNGVQTLTQIRIREVDTRPHGLYGEKEVTRIRVLEPHSFQVWEREEGKSDFELIEEGDVTLGAIPISTFYAKRTGFLMAEPPLKDMADLNAQHWQSSSDQRHILHFARVPMWFAAGFGEDDGALQEIGANRMIRASDPNAKLQIVEHSGAAIDAGRQDLLDLEQRMRVMGMEPLLPKSGNVTATAHAIDAAEAHSSVKAMALDLKDALERALGYMANWAGMSGDAGGSIQINTDFGIGGETDKGPDYLLKLRERGDLSAETLWEEGKRRNFLSPEFTAEREAERLLAEVPGGDEEEVIPSGRPLNVVA